MRIAHYLLRSRSGIYHSRLKVPPDLQAALGRRIIKISLRAADVYAARLYAYGLSVKYPQAFAALRGHGMPKPPPLTAIQAAD